MKAMLWMAVVVGVAVMATAVPSWADPLMPDFPDVWSVGQKVAGQSTLGVFYDPSNKASPIYVDWIVVYWGNVGPGGKPVWGYYYQVENPQTAAHGSIQVFIVESTLFYDGGFFSRKDLDANFTDFSQTVEGHTATYYSNLAGEFEPSPGTIKNPDAFGFIPGGVRYDFRPSGETPIGTGHESTILYAYSFLPPIYGPAKAVDTPEIHSASRVEWRGMVPVPTPEPGTVVLLIFGTMGVGFLSRRYRRK